MTKFINTLLIAFAATLSVSSAFAAGLGATGSGQPVKTLSATLTPSQRGAAVGQFVRKWGSYVENAYGLDVQTWAQRMVPQFAVGDAVNIQRALQRTTFEGAQAELNGAGHRLSDEQAITKLASLSGSAMVTPAALGDLDNDLVYTQITPCRIADTRLVDGPIAAGTSRAFGVWGFSDYVFQGGSTGDCDLSSESPQVAVLNVTAVAPAGAGYATVYPANAATPPATASVNYVAGAIVNNTVITPLGTVDQDDVKIFTYAASNYVVDIVGYYDAPHATPLDCIKTASSSVNIAAGASGGVSSPVCAASYTLSSGSCISSSADNSLATNSEDGGTWFCASKNNGASSAILFAEGVCCRVPGR